MNALKIIGVLAIGSIFFLSSSTHASSTGRGGVVISVHDGDTVVVKTQAGQLIKVRIAGIDAPELSQPYGRLARAHLVTQAQGKFVAITEVGVDAYGRTVAHIFVGDIDVAKALVREGSAWYSRGFSKDPDFPKAELAARIANRGLWALSSPIPPWDWRHAPHRPAAKSKENKQPLNFPEKSLLSQLTQRMSVVAER
jgi:micrococcal nuclease